MENYINYSKIDSMAVSIVFWTLDGCFRHFSHRGEHFLPRRLDFRGRQHKSKISSVSQLHQEGVANTGLLMRPVHWAP